MENVRMYVCNILHGPSNDQIKIDEKVLPHKAYLI